MKIKEKIAIKELVKNYNNKPLQTRDSYLKDCLSITSYVPFVKKVTLVEKLIQISMYEYENFTDENGEKSRRRTNNIKIDSVTQYLLFCRLIIENYTNLTIESEGFFDEYDLLKSSGLLDRLMVGDENTLPLIPINEIAEMKSLVEMKQKDVVANYMNPQGYIANQVTRFGELSGIMLKPIIDKAITKFENMTEEDAEKLGNKLDKVFKRIK